MTAINHKRLTDFFPSSILQQNHRTKPFDLSCTNLQRILASKQSSIDAVNFTRHSEDEEDLGYSQNTSNETLQRVLHLPYKKEEHLIYLDAYQHYRVLEDDMA